MKDQILAFLEWVEDRKDYKLMKEDYRFTSFQWETESATSLEIQSYIDEFIEEQERK